MRQTIIEMLRNTGENFLSGEDIALQLGISRAAVWKHIQRLREIGYEIVSRERCGYKFKDAPDLLLANEVKDGLNTQVIGKEIYYYPSTDSTNSEAKILAYRKVPDGTVVVSEEQTNGKGRLNRSFYSPRGKGIWFSLVLRPNLVPSDAPKCTLMAAVAIAHAMERFGLRAQIKWPNDIMYDGRKLVGILTELSAEMSRVTYIVLGIGINVNMARDEFPPELIDVATSLMEMSGEKISRIKFFRAVLEEFDKLYVDVVSDPKRGFVRMLDEWRKYNVTLGRKVRVITSSTSEYFLGTARDIDADGALLVETENVLERVFAGDVSIREDNVIGNREGKEAF